MVGEKLKALRKQKGVSQEAVAEYMHISQSAYARIEKGESSSWASYLGQLCDFFEVSPEELLKNETIVISQNQQGGESNNAYIINQLSEKLIAQYECRMAEKDALIAELRERLKKWENK